MKKKAKTADEAGLGNGFINNCNNTICLLNAYDVAGTLLISFNCLISFNVLII